MSNASVIRPGLLVVVKSTVVGGVSYQRIDLETGEPPVPGADVSRWETIRTIEDQEEYHRAGKTRCDARALIRKVCSDTTFGLVCPMESEAALDDVIARARKMVDQHNATAKHTQVTIYALKGRVASDDAEAARAISQEMARLIAAMEAGIAAFDPDAIRKAASDAREMSVMLGDEAKEKAEAAIDQARKAARLIVRRLAQEGVDRVDVMKEIQRGQIESARISFLDMDAPGESEALPAVAQQRFADLDLGSSEFVPPSTIAPTIFAALDLEETPAPTVPTLPPLPSLENVLAVAELAKRGLVDEENVMPMARAMDAADAKTADAKTAKKTKKGGK